MPLPAPGTLREDLVLSAGELPGSRVLPMDVVARFPAVIVLKPIFSSLAQYGTKPHRKRSRLR